jgi:hypothetical protein
MIIRSPSQRPAVRIRVSGRAPSTAAGSRFGAVQAVLVKPGGGRWAAEVRADDRMTRPATTMHGECRCPGGTGER